MTKPTISQGELDALEPILRYHPTNSDAAMVIWERVVETLLAHNAVTNPRARPVPCVLCHRAHPSAQRCAPLRRPSLNDL